MINFLTVIWDSTIRDVRAWDFFLKDVCYDMCLPCLFQGQYEGFVPGNWVTSDEINDRVQSFLGNMLTLKSSTGIDSIAMLCM